MRHSWFPVARSSDLDDGPFSATLLGERLAVYRGTDGLARVRSNRCPHRGGNLSGGKVHGTDLACPYHGWQFSGDDGACSRVPSLADQSKIPPKASIHAYPAAERFNLVWTCLEEPEVQLYELPEWQAVELEWMTGQPLQSTTGVGVAVENFRDVAHFPFVHAKSMGPTPEVVEPLQVRREGLDIYMTRTLHAGTGEWAAQGDCVMEYHCIAPGFSAITYDYADLGKRVVYGCPSPVAYDEIIIYWGVANEVGFRGDSLEECLKIEHMVYQEDMPVAGAVEPREIPWDGGATEESVPSDLFTLNYRRSFRELINRVNTRYAA
jgi:nitrite reductase/ring-hydroxylating ferredoxin subunit